MTIGADRAYADLRHVERKWTAMLLPCLYFVPCVHSSRAAPPLKTAGGVG